MDRVSQKRVARHIRSTNARHDRFVAAYTKAKYPEVFAEAKQYYEELNKKYSMKRDLTKTDEFLSQTTTYTSYYQMYRERYETKMKMKKTQKDTMELQIPLMDQDQVDIAIMEEKVDSSPIIPEHVYNALLKDLSEDPTTNMIFKEISAEQNTEQVNQILQELEDILPEIPDQTLLEKELE